jgi:Putative lumazine-binding
MGTTTTRPTDERTAIEATIQLYIDGASQGDAAKLREAFHDKGWMFGHVSGQRFDAPFTTMIQELTANPLDSDGGYRGRIVSVQQTGDGAVATVEESGCWGNVSFVDYFTLAKIDGDWKIVNKVFVHTGGECRQAEPLGRAARRRDAQRDSSAQLVPAPGFDSHDQASERRTRPSGRTESVVEQRPFEVSPLSFNWLYRKSRQSPSRMPTKKPRRTVPP